MQYGDTIRIEMKGKDGQSIFGAIDQNIAPPGGSDRGDELLSPVVDTAQD